MNKPRNNGFTLIELIIVIALMSVLIIGIMTTYIQIQKILNTQSIAASRGQEAEEFYEMLIHDIQNMVYEKWNKKFFFIADKNIIGGTRIDSLNFISGSLYSNPSLFQSRIYNVSYFGKNDSITGDLTIYRTEDMFVDYKEKNMGVPVPVLSKVTEFMIEFSQNGKDWLDTWDSVLNKNIPKFLRIHLKYIQTDESGQNERMIILQTSPGIFL